MEKFLWSDRYGHIGLALITNQGIQGSMAVPWVGLVVSIISSHGLVDLKGILLLFEVNITLSLCIPSLGLEPTPQLCMRWQAADSGILFPLHRAQTPNQT